MGLLAHSLLMYRGPELHEYDATLHLYCSYRPEKFTTSLGDVVDSGWQKLVEHVSNSVIVLLVDLVERLLQRKRLFSLLISFVSSVDPKE